jgi:Nif-specific regulatory protein
MTMKAEPTSYKEYSRRQVRQDAEKKMVSELNETITAATELPVLIGHIMKMAQRMLQAKASSVLLLDKDEQHLYFEFADGDVSEKLKSLRLNTKSGIAGWVARTLRPIIVNDVSRDKRFAVEFDKVTGFTTKSIICVPLFVRDKTIGVIEVINKIDGNDFTEHDLDILLSVASLAATAIENTKIQQLAAYGYVSAIRVLAEALDKNRRFQYVTTRQPAGPR